MEEELTKEDIEAIAERCASDPDFWESREERRKREALAEAMRRSRPR